MQSAFDTEFGFRKFTRAWERDIDRWLADNKSFGSFILASWVLGNGVFVAYWDEFGRGSHGVLLRQAVIILFNLVVGWICFDTVADTWKLYNDKKEIKLNWEHLQQENPATMVSTPHRNMIDPDDL